jgi:hypothetical protein
MRPSINHLRALALAATLATLLAACSEYLDRRNTVSLNAGDAVATDKVTQMVDPWPRDSADRNIAFNGERMQAAVARYRADRVIKPIGTGTSATYGQSSSAPPGAPGNNTTPLGPTVNSQTSAQ